MRKLIAVPAAGLVLAIAAGPSVPAFADVKPSAEAGSRYVMSPADGGVVRLDTRTGAMSICSRKDDQWACVPMPDSQDGLRREIERLEGENKDLRDSVKRLEEIAGLGDNKSQPGAPSTGAAPGGNRFGLPSQKDVDMAFDYMEGLVKRLWDRLRKLDGDESKGQPL